MEKKRGYPCQICGEHAGVNKHHNIFVCSECSIRLRNNSVRICKRCSKEGWYSCEPAYMNMFRETQEFLGISFKRYGNILFLTTGCSECCQADLKVKQKKEQKIKDKNLKGSFW